MATVETRSLERVRSDFPILDPDLDGNRLAYLDSAATAQKPRQVIDAVDHYLRRQNAPVHRSVYPLAEESTRVFEHARTRVAMFMHWEPAATIFTRNATESINLVAYSWGRANLGPGDEVLVTLMEHHSNFVPWQLLCQETGARFRYLGVSDEGTLSLDELDAVLAEGRVKLVAVAHISNVLGTLNPVEEIVRRAREAGALTLVDGAQAAPQLPVRLNELRADFYAWTGHKALGPTGIGVLHGRPELLEAMPPFNTGGHMISRVGLDSTSWADIPAKFEAGTSSMAEAVGLGAAVGYLSELGMQNVRTHERDLTAYVLERLADVPDLTVHGPSDPEQRGGVISFSIEGIHPHDIATLCGREGVCIRAGHHCAMPLMERLGVPATARASFHVYNTTEDVDRLIAALHKAREVFNL